MAAAAGFATSTAGLAAVAWLIPRFLFASSQGHLSEAHDPCLGLLRLSGDARTQDDLQAGINLYPTAFPDSVIAFAVIAFSIGAFACMYVDLLAMAEDQDQTTESPIVDTKVGKSDKLCECRANSKDVLVDSADVQAIHDVKPTPHSTSANAILFGPLLALSLGKLSWEAQQYLYIANGAALPDSIVILSLVAFALGALACMYTDVLDMTEDFKECMTDTTVQSTTKYTGCEHCETDKDAQNDSVNVESDLVATSSVAHSICCMSGVALGIVVVTLMVWIVALWTTSSNAMGQVSLPADITERYEASDIPELELYALAHNARSLRVPSTIFPTSVAKVILLISVVFSFVTTCADAKDAVEEEAQESHKTKPGRCLQENKKVI